VNSRDCYPGKRQQPVSNCETGISKRPFAGEALPRPRFQCWVFSTLSIYKRVQVLTPICICHRIWNSSGQVAPLPARKWQPKSPLVGEKLSQQTGIKVIVDWDGTKFDVSQLDAV
jgi:hypothetical protein